jgi:hydroxypyruvate isomerase
MPRFAANLSMLFADAPLLERFERAARAGFTAVELAFPYAYAVKDLMQRLQRTSQAVGILDQVGATNAFLLYDVYHAQRSEGELAATLQKFLPRIAHIQVADNTGRNEPGTGEINFPFLFEHLDRIGYAGWIGCEYKPATATEAGLGWLAGVSTDAQ